MSFYEMNFELTDSSLLKSVSYDDELLELTLEFRETYFKEKEVFIEVYPLDFTQFTQAKSFGKYYLNFIKSHFKLKKMAKGEKPVGVNKASSAKRFIELEIDVKKINKDWLRIDEKGRVWMTMVLGLLPDGEVNQYGQLGAVSQKVPTDKWKADNELKDIILGNGMEKQWGNKESTPSSNSAAGVTEPLDDLPF